ncbi:MAG: hypothetical protein ABMA13_07440 [Chthoniobacteraceae bacterium]
MRRAVACLLACGMFGDAGAAEKTKAKFANERPRLRPLFGSVHEHGVEPNKFNDGGEKTVQKSPPKAPKKAGDAPGFNPDPGGVTPDPKSDWTMPGAPDALSPTTAGAYGSLFPESQYPQGEAEPFLPDSLMMPRRDVEGMTPVRRTFHIPEYYDHAAGYSRFRNSESMPNRWNITVPHWQRYMDPANETPYQYDTPHWWHPYRQSRLKGDVPVFGTQDIFMNITAKSFSLFEKRKLPTPSGVSSAQAQSSEFFGRSESILASTDLSIAIDLFQGETAFKPVHWMVRVLGVYNNNWIRVKETAAGTNPDPRGTNFDDNDGQPDTGKIEAFPGNGNDYGPDTTIASFASNVSPADAFNYIHDQLNPTGDAARLVEVDENNYPKDGKDGKPTRNTKDFNGSRYTTRHRDFFALQEAFAEFHISDLTDNYDFISSRWGIQPFVSDFRGFVFADTNLGARVFGNWDNNRIQYNVAYFNMREKDTYSDLNMFDSRHQQVFITNVFRQDFLFKGYTAQLSFLANYDDGGTHYQKDGFATRPIQLGSVPDEEDSFNGFDGTLRSKKVKAYYLGWNGDGHIGRLNLTHSFYYVFGEDEFNGLAGRKVDISAAMGAAELSYDRDWVRVKLSGFYASGDSKPLDRTATGFDTILDNPFFIGGPFSWYVHQGFNLAGTGVNLKQRDSLVPNLRTSKTEGQSNFVNPGVTILGFGTDLDVTPKLRTFFNANYIWFNDTDPLRLALQTNKVRTELGLDLSLGLKYRPFLTEQVIVSAGFGALFPGAGYRDIYRRSTEHVPGYGAQEEEGKVDRYLYNAFFTLTLIY